jgi:hypothetical protein
LEVRAWENCASSSSPETSAAAVRAAKRASFEEARRKA